MSPFQSVVPHFQYIAFVVKPLWTAVNALCFIVKLFFVEKPQRTAINALCFVVRLLVPASSLF